MICLYLFILMLFLLLFIVSRKENVSSYIERRGDKTFIGERCFSKAAAWLIKQKDIVMAGFRKNKKPYRELWNKEQQRKSRLGAKLKLLNPEMPEAQQIKDFYIKQYSLVLLILFTGNLLVLCVAVSVRMGSLIKGDGYIERNSYGEGNIELMLSAKLGGRDEEEIPYTVSEKKIPEDQINLLYEKASLALPTAILGDNDSLDSVTENLNLITSMDGYPFTISWESNSYSIVHTDGTVQNDDLEAPEVVTLTACFKYDELEFEDVFPVQICPAELTEKEQLNKKLNAALEEQDQLSRTEDRMVLPKVVGDEPVVWKEMTDDSSSYLFLLICITAVFIFISQNKDTESLLKKRDRELLLDYPEIINKLTLYMGAGMTIRNAFFKMGEDYKKQKNPAKKRYVYEEILLLCHELQSGVSETEVYTHLGKRCSLQQYMKLSALLSQNIRKGNSNFIHLMRQEATEAFNERKNTAKKLGEEAGTKLLVPMMMMLCIVMVIIMIPAYFSFSM